MKRILIMYDLSTLNTRHRRLANQFRKMIISYGFIMLTESCYTRALKSLESCNYLLMKIKKKLPKQGQIQWLVINETAFCRMEYLIGEPSKNIELQMKGYIEIE